MPRGQSKVGLDQAEAPRLEPFLNRERTRSEQARAFGRLHSLQVADVPDAPPVVRQGRPIGSAREWRNAANAILTGSGEAPKITPKDSGAAIVRKIGGLSNTALATTFSNTSMFMARTAGQIKSLTKLGEIKMPGWYSQGAMSAAVLPFSGATGAISGAIIAKRSYDIGYEVAADIANHKQREKVQTLLADFDPISYKFRSPVTGEEVESRYRKTQLANAIAAKNTWNTSEGGNIWRNKKQRALDVLGKVKDVAVLAPSGSVSNLISVAATAGTTLAVAGTGFAVAGHIAVAANSFAKLGVQASAIANIENMRLKAKENIVVPRFTMSDSEVKVIATNQLLQNVANRMIQERVYTSRLLFWSGCSFAFSAAANIAGLLTSGVGVAASSFLSAVGLMLSGGVSLGFGVIHGRTLASRRAQAVREYEDYKELYRGLPAAEKLNYFKTMDSDKKIGLLELHLLDTLREGSPEEAYEIYNFLEGCGVSENTIKSLILMPRNDALSALQTQLYSARMHVKDGKHLAHAAGYISGVTYLSRHLKRQHPTATLVPAT